MLNSLLNIYECGKNIYQLTHECACTASDQIFESVVVHEYDEGVC